MKRFLFLLTTSLVLISCGNNSKNEEEKSDNSKGKEIKADNQIEYVIECLDEMLEAAEQCDEAAFKDAAERYKRVMGELHRWFEENEYRINSSDFYFLYQLYALDSTSEPEPEPYSPSVDDWEQMELEQIERTDQQEEEPKMENKKVQTAVVQDAIKIMPSEAKEMTAPELIFTDNTSEFDDFEFEIEEEEEWEPAEDDAFTILEDPATFKGGGLPEFRKWVMEHLRYPQIALENGIQGNVVIEFVINESGAVDRIKVLQSPDQSLADAAIATLKKSPKWKPGKQRGKAVK
jgi:protein TonB